VAREEDLSKNSFLKGETKEINPAISKSRQNPKTNWIDRENIQQLKQ